LSDLWESGFEENIAGSCGDTLCFLLAVDEDTGVSLRALPTQVFFNQAAECGSADGSRAVDSGGLSLAAGIIFRKNLKSCLLLLKRTIDGFALAD
jgi:hypothetical protein